MSKSLHVFAGAWLLVLATLSAGPAGAADAARVATQSALRAQMTRVKKDFVTMSVIQRIKASPEDDEEAEKKKPPFEPGQMFRTNDRGAKNEDNEEKKSSRDSENDAEDDKKRPPIEPARVLTNQESTEKKERSEKKKDEKKEDKDDGDEDEDPPRLIHSVPRMAPDDNYKRHLGKIYQRAKEDTREVHVHNEKLEQEALKLKHQVQYLSEELEEKEREEALGKARKATQKALRDGDWKKESTAPSEAIEGMGEDAEENNKTGRIVAVLMFGTVFFMSLITFLTQYNISTACCTWEVIENVICIFIAVMWFNAFDDLCHVGGLEKHHEALAGFLHAVFIFFMALIFAWYIRENHGALAVFSAAGAHYVSFASLHAAGSLQEAFFDEHIGLCFLSIFVILLVLIGVMALTREVKRRGNFEEEEYADATEELENDAESMVLAFVWTMFIRYLICGRYPPLEEEHSDHTMLHRTLFLMYGFGMLAFSVAMLPVMHRWLSEAGTWPAARASMLMGSFLTMATAWAFLLWADWEFYENHFKGEHIFGRIVFAMVASVVCLGILVPLNYVGWQTFENSAVRKLIIGALSLVVGFSWEETFDSALEAAVDDEEHPAATKIYAAVLVLFIVVPVYVKYLRPIVERAQEAQHAAEMSK